MFTEDGTGEIVKAALVFEITPAEEVKKEDKTKTQNSLNQC